LSAQENSDTYELAPKPIVSELEFMVGPDFIYPFVNIGSESRVVKVGVVASLGLTHQFSSKVSLNFKLSYENKGIRSIYYSLNEDYNPPAQQKGIQNITLNYVTVALLPRYHPLKKVNVYIGAGPYFGYLISEKFLKEVYINGQLVSKSGGNPDPHEFYKEYDLGLTSLVGYNFRLTSKFSGCLQFIYNLGMTDVIKSQDEKLRNNSFIFLVGISLPK
jgi:hypothetical protein